MLNESLKRQWGFHPIHEAFFTALNETRPNLVPARVIFSSHDHYRVLVIGDMKEMLARVRGGLFRSGVDLPVVGDWVAVDVLAGDHDFLPIVECMPRTTSLKRVDTQRGSQTLMANVDYIGLVTSFNQDLNERRLERGMAMIEESGAKPLIIINKSDITERGLQEKVLSELTQRFPHTPLIACSAQAGLGLEKLVEFLGEGQCLALLGMSGVGKSTLINALLNEKRQETSEIRAGDSRGKHTTTHRELVLTKGGFWLIDSPGIRSFSMSGEEEDLDRAFADIAELMAACRFGNCSHQSEPGCQITAALESGALSEDRFANYLKIRREVEFHVKRENKRQQNQKRKTKGKG